MIHLPHLLSRLPALIGALALTALLAACTISSKELLVSDDEAVTPLPATLYFFSYEKQKGDDSYALTGSEPAAMTLEGKVYVADDRSLMARLVPLDQPDTYLLAATGKDENTIYGVARYRAPILELKVVMGTDTTAEYVAAALPGVTVEEEGIIVADRAALDAAIALMRNSKTEIGTLVMFVTDSKDAAVPKTLVPDGDSLKPGS